MVKIPSASEQGLCLFYLCLVPIYLRLTTIGPLQYLIEPKSGVVQKKLKNFGSRYCQLYYVIFSHFLMGEKSVCLVLIDERHLSSSMFLCSVNRCITFARAMDEDMWSYSDYFLISRSYSELLSHLNNHFGIICLIISLLPNWGAVW